MKKIALSIVLWLTVFLVASPAAAVAPVVEDGVFAENRKIDQQPCPGIEVWDDEVATYTLTTFFDNKGNPVRMQIHATGIDKFYNPMNPAVVLSGHFVHNFWLDFRTGALTETGVPLHITVPGYGTVLVEAGRWFADGRVVGKHSFSDASDMTQFCALLTAH
jgi:hypothetical protein